MAWRGGNVSRGNTAAEAAPEKRRRKREREREKLGGGPSSSLSIVVQTRKRPFFFSFSTPPPPHSPHYTTYRLHHHPLFFLLGRQFKVQGMGVSSPTPPLLPSFSISFSLAHRHHFSSFAGRRNKTFSFPRHNSIEGIRFFLARLAMAATPPRTFSLSPFIVLELSERQHCNSPRNPSSSDPYVSFFFPPSASAPFARPSLPPY